MGTNYYAVKNKPTTSLPIHIGKSFSDWKVLFQSQHETGCFPSVVWNDYDELIDWLEEHIVEKKDYVILNEYDEQMSLEDFKKIVELGQAEHKDSPRQWEYCKNIKGYWFTDEEFS